MNFDSFFAQYSDHELEGAVPQKGGAKGELTNDALFQLPLIALIILVLAKDRRKPKVQEIGQFVGETIELTMSGFKGSSHQLGWSAGMRIRTVNALRFLDAAGLVNVLNDHGRVSISELGKKVLLRATEAQADDLAYNLAQIARAYRNICVARQLDLQIS
ncbi:hypothetical protein GTP45_02055 [Pseudoduganella sp. FT55W]|uniref:Uncharacterized protein n=1 Tax=Duganella rivi TaxID=2666083 RepID=A0A7X4K937_9BURK|nr:hypothetical protein [Duganella rivi]MYM65616.1 hypothetical protein [Duganella rivi]